MASYEHDDTMPLIQVSQHCPVCDHGFGCLQVDPDSFRVKSTAVDFKPVYEWSRRVYSRCNPEIYHIIICPECGFGGDQNAFLYPLRNLGFSMTSFVRKAREALERGVFREVATVLDAGASTGDFLSGIRRFLHTIFFLEQLPTVRECDALPLARYCLHLSWLYFDMDRSRFRDDIHRQLIEYKKAMGDRWPAPPLNEIDALAAARKYYETCYYNSAHIADRDGNDISILQLIGRIGIRLKDYRAAQDALFKCIKITNERAMEIKKNMNSAATPAEARAALLSRIYEMNSFVLECRDLLAMAKGHKPRAGHEHRPPSR